MAAAEFRGEGKPKLNEALGWIGSRVDDIYGAGVGRLEDVWIDPGTGVPRWLLVREGRFDGRTTLIPFEDATAGAGHVWVPYEREVVAAAPEVEPGAPLTQHIEAALANTSPWEGAVCRPMKVGKEEVMGALAAVEAWSKMDLEALNRKWKERVERIAKLVETVPGVTTNISIPEGGNRYPTLTVNWDEAGWKYTVADCDRQLREGEPRIEVLTASNPSLVPAVSGKDPKTPRHNKLQIISMTMEPGEELVVGKRLRELLNAARKNAKA